MVGAIHKVRTQILAIDEPPSPCTQRVRCGLDSPSLYARTQFDLMYTKYNKHNIELVNRSPKLSFYANMPVFNYNIKFIKYKYLMNISKIAYVRGSLTPPPPRLRMCTHRPRSLLSVRTYFMDDLVADL